MFSYKSQLPTNARSNYSDNDNIDFLLVGGAGESLICNTLFLEGSLSVTHKTGGVGPTDKIYYDGMVGAHSFIDSLQVETQSGGVIENIGDAYPRTVKMLRSSSMTREQLISSKYVPELCAPSDYLTHFKLMGEMPLNSLKSDVINPNFEAITPDFSVKLNICLNRATTPDGSVPLLQLEKYGYVKLNLKLARLSEALFGEDIDNTTDYTITDLRLVYKSMMQPASQPVIMGTTTTFKSVIQSSLTNISARVPTVANSVLVSFIQQNQEQDTNFNNLLLQEIPNIKFLEFIFNDDSNRVITYQLKDKPDILNRAMNAVKMTGNNSAQAKFLKGNDGFLVGTDFGGQFIDFTNQKLSLNISADTNNSNPYTMYFYFNGIQELN